MASVFKRNGRGPWVVSYFDAENRRRLRSTRTTDKRTADRIAADIEAKVALRREGLIDARQDRLAEHARRPLAEHVADYLAHCRTAEQAERHVAQKASHLAAFQAESGLSRPGELEAAALEGDLRRLRETGLSARTVNFRRQIVVAFANWLVGAGRLPSNPLKRVPKLDEQRDRRRVRRALTDDELARLIAEARPRGRALWYLTAALAGLRKGELRALRWADVDLDAGVLTVRNSKAGRTDEIPLHPQLAVELRAARPELALPTAAVFPRTVTDRTRQQDFERAGIAAVDDAGRVADLHACRTALGTRLARLGVAPQVAQRVCATRTTGRLCGTTRSLGSPTRPARSPSCPTSARRAARRSRPRAPTERRSATVSTSVSSRGTKPCVGVRRRASEPSRGTTTTPARKARSSLDLQGSATTCDLMHWSG